MIAYRNKSSWFVIVLALSMLCSCSKPDKTTQENSSTTVRADEFIPAIGYTVKGKFPHDRNAFTEGFVFYRGELFESTGATVEFPQTRSLFGTVDFKTGEIAVKAELDKQVYFGEGIVFLNDKVYQVTYKNRQGFIYDAKSFKQLGDFTYSNAEGWGLTTDGKYVIMSDGTASLTYFDPQNMAPVKKLLVTENDMLVERLNELEYIKGYIYANVWMTNTIVKINPSSGKVVGKMDLSNIDREARSVYPGALELNGIAYDSTANRFLVTGKMWPHIYELQLSY